jgi:class 3 adenylate cyclase
VAVQLDRFHGREIDTAGDGVFAICDGAARALECAEAIRGRASAEGFGSMRESIWGRSSSTVGRPAGPQFTVARIAAAAQFDEILASESTRALCTGSGRRFEDRGEYALKGLDQPRHLYRYDGAP